MSQGPPLHLLLTGRFDADERRQWHDALAHALPGVIWHLDDGGREAPLVEAAVVADPEPGVLRSLPNLRFVQSLWAGVESVLADASLPPQVPVARMVDPAMSAAMAETALWACLSLHRGFFTYARQQAAGAWRQWPQRRADEVQVAVLGLGRMGGAVARRLRGQGYRVVGWAHDDRMVRDDAIATHTGREALPVVLSTSDIVVNLLPLTFETKGLLDRNFFAAMKRGAAVVNLARGGHLVDDDLLSAVAAGQVGHAVLDVFDTEPLPPGHAYWSHPQVTVLPHAAAMTDVRSAAALAIDNILAWRDGRPIANLVDRAKGY